MSSQQRTPVVMVVEDQAANMMLARAILERAGYEVREASDADEAREEVGAGLPDLILMDIGLPGQDGLSLTREFKSDSRLTDIPIIALTAHAMSSDEQRARSAGCDGYLSKPFSPRQLTELVAAMLDATGLAASRRCAHRQS